MLSTFAAALRTDPDLKPLLPTDPSPTAFDLLQVLATKPFPVSLAPSSIQKLKAQLLPPDNVLTCRATSTNAVATVWSTGAPLVLVCSLSPVRIWRRSGGGRRQGR